MEEAPRALFAIGRPGESPVFLPVEVLELTVQALAWVSAESSQAAHKALFIGPKAEESMTRALLRLRAAATVWQALLDPDRMREAWDWSPVASQELDTSEESS